MPISPVLSEKWDRRLYNWLVWQYSGGGDGWGLDAKISSAYRGKQYGRTGYRTISIPVIAGEATDTDRLLHAVFRENKGVHGALIAWTKNEGERGTQAAKLGIHRSTYYDRVDAGKQLLEQLERQRRNKKKCATT